MNIPNSSSVIWTDEGIELSAKEVSGLSIEDNSVLWGTWVEARVEQPDPSRNHGPFVERTTSSPYQLVVTPLPPDTWPISFCIQLQLADVPHSFTYPTRLLGALGLNILSVRTSPAGFHHTTWTAVCEASELRRKIYHQTRSLRHCLSPSRSKMMDIESQAGDGPDGIVNFDLADLSPEQQDALSRSGQSLVLSQSQQQRLLEAIRTQRGLKIKALARDTLMLSQEQRAELANSGGVALTSKQVAVACLVERSVPLESNDKAKVWREFAYSFAERVLLRMHEALWCLRIVSHLSQRILEQNKNDPELAMIAAEGMVSAWRKHQKSDLGTIVKAMKYVIDGAGYKYRLEPTLDEKKIFHTAYQKLGFNGYESAESFWSAFCELNQKGFLHYRLLYGQSFLAGEPDGNELFAEYAGNPLEDQPCKGGQSLQRIVNGIKRDGAQDTMASYADVAENLIDRSREWRAHEQMLSDAGESPTLHYKLAFLLNVDGKRRIAKAADGRLLAQLMHLWISMRGDLVRVREFRYRRERSLLQPSGRSMSQTFPNECSLTLPLRSSLSVNALHCVARFFPITDAHQGNLLRVRATYEVRFPKRTAVIEDFVHAANGAKRAPLGDDFVRSSDGILKLVTRVLDEAGATIMACSTHIADRPRHLDSTERPRDRGAVVVDAILPQIKGPNAASAASAIERAVEGAFKEASKREAEEALERQTASGRLAPRRILKLRKVRATPHALIEVFISTRFEDEFWSDLKEPILAKCRDLGFEPRCVGSGALITGEIIKHLGDAHCFLQIVPFLRTDKDLGAVNLGWLQAEYMCALIRGIPTVRAVQIDRHAGVGDWQKVLKVNPDQVLEQFVHTTELLDRTLPDMLNYLRRELLQRETF